MKYLALLLLAIAPASAGNWSVAPGLSPSDLGAITIHDFKSKGTDAGFQWDALHFKDKGVEEFEGGSFVVQRDTDKHVILGPDLGLPGASLGDVCGLITDLAPTWTWVNAIKPYAALAHAYVNVGWDFSRPSAMHLSPDLIGAGGVLKFGGN